MAQEAEQYRLALSVFAEPGDLWRTVFHLLETGLATDQICLVARGGTIAPFAPTPAMVDGRHDQLAALHQQLWDWSGSPDGAGIITTSAPLLQILLGVHRPGSGAAETALASIGLEPDFLNYVRDGSVALIVRSPDAAQQLRTTQTLLDNATRTVSTYELIIPADHT